MYTPLASIERRACSLDKEGDHYTKSEHFLQCERRQRTKFQGGDHEGGEHGVQRCRNSGYKHGNLCSSQISGFPRILGSREDHVSLARL